MFAFAVAGDVAALPGPAGFAAGVPLAAPRAAGAASGAFNCASVATFNVINDGFSLYAEIEMSLELCANPSCEASM